MQKFWKFIKNIGVGPQGPETETIELHIEGDIVEDDDVWLYEFLGITFTTPNAFKEELKKYDGKDIIVWIDSYGGDVFAAAGIYNALKEHKGKVTVKIDGKAMSAASVIAMAGDEVLMSPVAIMMIHNPLTMAEGDMYYLRKAADILDTVKETLINAYALKTGRSKAKISAMMDDETWMSAGTAIKEGFADGMLYTETQPAGQVVADFRFDRLAIVNNAKKSFDRVMALEKFKIKDGISPEDVSRELVPKNQEWEQDSTTDLLKAKLELEIIRGVDNYDE